jgi:hypothetical protein
VDQDINNLYVQIGELVKKAIILNFRIQGHVMTGDLIDTINYKIESTDIGGRIDFYLNDYGIYQNYGVTPSQIKKPFAKPRIEGLQRFAKLKLGISDDKEALSVAFAIAKKHSIEGMPTKNSRSMGKKLDALGDAIKDTEKEVEKMISEAMEYIITTLISNSLPDYEENRKFFSL